MNRGDVILAALPREFGRPRPAVVLQETDVFPPVTSLTVAPLSTHASGLDIRIVIDPSPANGLRRRSEAMIDKLTTVERERVGPVVGRIAPSDMTQIERALATFLGLG